MDTCFICKDFLTVGEVVEVKAKGVATLLSAAISRGDDNEHMLQNIDNIRVHVNCRKKYINTRMVSAAARRRMTEPQPSISTSVAVDEPEPPQEQLEQEQFDFEHLCLFCGELTSVVRDSRSKRQVSLVVKRDTQQKFVTKLQQCNDNFMKNLIFHIMQITNKPLETENDIHVFASNVFLINR